MNYLEERAGLLPLFRDRIRPKLVHDYSTMITDMWLNHLNKLIH